MDEVVFLFGAGASVKAGVPDTYKFVVDFEKSIEETGEKETVQMILAILEKWQKRQGFQPAVDVELLLEVLTKLDARDKEPLLEFLSGATFRLPKHSNTSDLLRLLRDFIKKKAIVRWPAKIQYLVPLRGFIQENRPLEVISVNYDTCVEQFCSSYKLDYQDGFDVNWNPKVFEAANVDIRLYKLHGSVIWYRSDRGNYLKLPVMTEESAIRLITGEKAESLMLYPMQKFDYAEPLLELLVRVKEMLQNKCKFLVVAGYSFRDDHIRRILLDAARRNSGLIVVLVDPRATEIYRSKLQFFNSAKGLLSPLAGRVVCLPYTFESVLPLLKDDFLLNLRNGLRIVQECTSGSLVGKTVDWAACIAPLASAEHVDELIRLKKEVRKWGTPNRWDAHTEVLVKMAVNLMASGRHEDADDYLNQLKVTLCEVLGSLEVLPAYVGKESVVYYQFRNPSFDPPSMTKLEVAAKHIESLRRHVQSRSTMTTNKRYLTRLAFLERLAQYVEARKGTTVSLGQFLSLNKALMSPEELQEIEDAKSVEGKTEVELRSQWDRLSMSMTTLERKAITKMLS